MRFSANLGFLFTGQPLAGAVHAAKAAGFDAVECHFPFHEDPGEVATALRETGLSMLGLNTWPGDRAGGDFGLCALPGREAEARAAIDQAVAYARAVGCGAVHVMAGRTDGGPAAEAAFQANLAHACAMAPDLTVLIEPLNWRDVPGYHLVQLDHAAAVVAAVGAPNLRIMFDAYHVQVMRGDLCAGFARHRDVIGHLQIAAVPDRGEPDEGELDLRWFCGFLAREGWVAPIGAEYRPRGGDTAKGLGWLRRFRA